VLTPEPLPRPPSTSSQLICYNPATVPKIINDRGVYYKERAAATYRSLVYTLGLLLVEIPFTLIALTLFTYDILCLRLKVTFLFFSTFVFPLPSPQYSLLLHCWAAIWGGQVFHILRLLHPREPGVSIAWTGHRCRSSESYPGKCAHQHPLLMLQYVCRIPHC